MTRTHCLLVVAALAACKGDEDSGDAVFFAPDADGAYLPGTAESEAPGPNGLTLPVQVWFPASDASENAYPYDGVLTLNARYNGVPACDEPRPVIVFSHGNQGLRYQSAGLLERLATHGWVIVAPDHVRNTAFDYNPDEWPDIALRRPSDVQAAFDWLIAQDEIDGIPFDGCVDPDAGYVVMGHSFGGWTTNMVAGGKLDMEALLQACIDEGETCPNVQAWVDSHDEAFADLSDPRVVAGVPLAPAYFGNLAEDLSGTTVPMLTIGAELDKQTTWEDSVLPAYTALSSTPRALAGLDDAGHMSFTSVCPLLGELPQYDGCGEGYRHVDEVAVTLNALTLAWLRSLSGEEGLDEWLPPAEGMFHWEEER